MIWDGAFSPQLNKHRLGTGDIANHISVSPPVVNETLGIVTVQVSFNGSSDTYKFDLPAEYFPSNKDGSPRVNKESVGQAIVRLWDESGGNISGPPA